MEIAGEAARAAVGAIQAQSVIYIVTVEPKQHQNVPRNRRGHHFKTHPHEDITFTNPGFQATPFQDSIPPSYVKEIQSGWVLKKLNCSLKTYRIWRMSRLSCP